MKPAFRKLSLPVSSSFVLKNDDMPIKNPWHYHPEIEIAYSYKGKGTVFVGDTVEILREHDLLMFGSNLPHTTQRDYSYYEKHLNEKPLAVIVQFLPGFLGWDLYKAPEFQRLDRLFKVAGRGIRFTGKSREKIGKKLMAMQTLSPSTRLLRLLSILVELAECEQYELLCSEGFVNVYGELHHARLNMVYEYSVNHFMERIALEKVADLANLTPAAFCRFFKSRTGATYHEYLATLRINFSCKLLAENRIVISEVARQSGFQNLSLFNRKFKELKGVTPSEFQRGLIFFTTLRRASRPLILNSALFINSQQQIVSK